MSGLGAYLAAGQLVFANNQIDHFGDDGIDYAASNLAITRNNLHDNLDIGDGNHEDAMQGLTGYLAPGATVNHFQNIVIDSNAVIRQTDPELSFPTGLQGIDAFDSRLDERHRDQQRRNHEHLLGYVLLKHPQQPDR